MSWLVKFGVDVLELMFLTGAAGTVLVLILSAIEDFHTVIGGSVQD